ncbi:MAG: hypothetical protein JW973_03060 [Bacteroidales bacterium]|nr:hypothetical protein [Bacteroidales bacterium]
MKKIITNFLIYLFILPVLAQQYQNFRVSVYCTARDVAQMNDTTKYLLPRWNEISRQMRVDKVYLETHRDLLIVDQKTLDIAKKFFNDRGVEIAGGITYTVQESEHFRTFCYNDPDDRKMVKEIAEYTAINFNEIILDDFFFTSCKSDGAIQDKGNRSWTEYRLNLMADAAQNLIVGPAKKVNPGVRVIIKYPNWYEHFQGLGFNLEKEPGIFDGIYTGTETRDAVLSEQHLQQYLGYNIFRFFENIAPGRNGGGWVDPFGMGNYDRYAEQLWITAFAKAPEITLFNFSMLSRPIDQSFRSPWQGQNTSFDYETMMQPVNYNGTTPVKPTTLARVAGYALETVDEILGETGNPIGIKSYKPFHSTGEDFLINYLGMIGLPMDERPGFPAGEKLVLLTEKAKYDPEIIEKMKNQLNEGKKVVITSGLLRELQEKGLRDIVELRYTDRKAIVQDFTCGNYKLVHGDKPVLMQQIQYLTNDSWEIVSGISGANGWPILHMADYSKGKLFVLTIPDNFADLYNLPTAVLNKIRETLCCDLEVYMEGPSNISLYLYDNKTFIIESFLDSDTTLEIITFRQYNKITDIAANQFYTGELRQHRSDRRTFGMQERNAFRVTIKPHSFRIFRYE